MQYSDACVALTKESEGFRAKVYYDTGNHPTIGYGHKLKPGELFTSLADEEAGEYLLRSDLDIACAAVNRLANPPQGLWQGAVDALTDFTFNVGQGKLGSSTLLRLLNSGDIQGASEQFARWVFASGTALPGLVRRREREREMFLSDAPTTPSSDDPSSPSPESPPQ